MAKKEAILERASKVFYKFGLSKISMDELADQIGISKKTIYNNFGSKDNLLEAIIFNSMENVLKDLTEILTNKGKGIVDKIISAIQQVYIQYSNFEIPIKSDPNAARIIYSPECICLNDQILGIIQELAQEAQSSGIIKKSINIKIIPYLFVNNIRGLVTWEPSDNFPYTNLDFMKQSLTIIIDGILTPEAMDQFLKSQ